MLNTALRVGVEDWALRSGPARARPSGRPSPASCAWPPTSSRQSPRHRPVPVPAPSAEGPGAGLRPSCPSDNGAGRDGPASQTQAQPGTQPSRQSKSPAPTGTDTTPSAEGPRCRPSADRHPTPSRAGHGSSGDRARPRRDPRAGPPPTGTPHQQVRARTCRPEPRTTRAGHGAPADQNPARQEPGTGPRPTRTPHDKGRARGPGRPEPRTDRSRARDPGRTDDRAPPSAGAPGSAGFRVAPGAVPTACYGFSVFVPGLRAPRAVGARRGLSA